MQHIYKQERVPEEFCGERLDQVAARLFPQYSRSRIQEWIRSGELRVDKKLQKPKSKVLGGELLQIDARLEQRGDWQAQEIALDILHEDEHLLVINKAVGLVVHPGAGNPQGTLLNAVLHHFPAAASLPRAGIVHRLDKETSGIMVVAKTLTAQTRLVEQLQSRAMGREYEAVVHGVLVAGGVVEAPIGRHPRERTKMAVADQGKPAVTHYRVLQRFRDHSHLRLKLESGRTHQIRVHMSHIRHALVGDPVYGGRARVPKAATDELREYLAGFKRQALHAHTLRLTHPLTGEVQQWSCGMPEDMQELIRLLQQDSAENG